MDNYFYLLYILINMNLSIKIVPISILFIKKKKTNSIHKLVNIEMRLLIFAVGVVCSALAEEQIALNYHEDYGIPLATSIKRAEEAGDFDGARVVGGWRAGLGDHPHLGGVLVNLYGGAVSVCACSLLTNTRAVTAAHCWWDGYNLAIDFTLVYGSLLLFSGGMRVNTSAVDVHAAYNSNNLNNDIAVVILPWVNYTAEPITVSQYLSHVNVTVISNQECEVTYGNSVVVPATVCSSGAGFRGTCLGDSGGSLWAWIGGSRFLIGVTSFHAARGCELGLPSGYTRITIFVPWIQERL
ncbi:brachyurin-like isoform X2 [Galleria mellonella]|uniref:Brachyurin-like isoform X2 n=1 Tax=Galleria mellonella TaxID=7137 RepID=A0ABM3N6K0_GALME|nr:brachyurin-like isoform X2 [Galleria mellonella]